MHVASHFAIRTKFRQRREKNILIMFNTCFSEFFRECIKKHSKHCSLCVCACVCVCVCVQPKYFFTHIWSRSTCEHEYSKTWEIYIYIYIYIYIFFCCCRECNLNHMYKQCLLVLNINMETSHGLCFKIDFAHVLSFFMSD